jgi:hypothetical protein
MSIRFGFNNIQKGPEERISNHVATETKAIHTRSPSSVIELIKMVESNYPIQEKSRDEQSHD